MRLITRYKRLNFWNKVGFVASVFGIIGFFLMLFLYFFPYQKGNYDITHVVYNDNFLKVYNTSGIAWSKKFNGMILKADIVELNNKSKQNILVSVGRNESMTNLDLGFLFCFNEKGDELWIYKNTYDFNYLGATSNKMIIKDFIVKNFAGEKNQILINNGDADGWYQSNISLISNNGNLISTYWHPGVIIKIEAIKEIDGSYSVLFHGINNDLGSLIQGQGYLHVIGKLPGIFSGEAVPYAGKQEKGNEVWYLAILPKGNAIRRISISHLNSDGMVDIAVWTESGNNIHLNTEGDIIRLSSTDKVDKSDFNILKIK